MICWYCHWGWPKQVSEIYEVALKNLGGCESLLHFGPSHVVWEDENFDGAEWCLEHFDDYEDNNYSNSNLEIVRWSLKELVKLPLHIRCVEPEDYDGEHPELFPPQNGIEMVRR